MSEGFPALDDYFPCPRHHTEPGAGANCAYASCEQWCSVTYLGTYVPLDVGEMLASSNTPITPVVNRCANPTDGNEEGSYVQIDLLNRRPQGLRIVDDLVAW